MITKRLEEARGAFSQGDTQASVAAHDPELIAHAAKEEHGGTSHQYIGDMVYVGWWRVWPIVLVPC